MVSISLDIPQESYDQLVTLSETYSQDVHETLIEILRAFHIDFGLLLESKEKDVIPISLQIKIFNLLTSGSWADAVLFNSILKELDAEGLYFMDNCDFDLDDNRISVYYEALKGCELVVDSFDVNFSGLKNLSADCIFNVDDDTKTLEHVLEHAKRIKRLDEELPEEFHNLDPWTVDVWAEDGNGICINTIFSEESISNLPSIPAISRFFKRVLESAGITKSIA